MPNNLAFFIFSMLMTGCAVRSPYSFFQPVHSGLYAAEIYLEERRHFYDHTEPSADRWLEDGTVSEVQSVQVRHLRTQYFQDVCSR